MTAPEIQQEIERTRERLGATVEELAARADLKARARGKVTEVTAKAQDTAADLWVQRGQLPRRWPAAAAAAGAVIAGTVLVWRRRRK